MRIQRAFFRLVAQRDPLPGVRSVAPGYSVFEAGFTRCRLDITVLGNGCHYCVYELIPPAILRRARCVTTLVSVDTERGNGCAVQLLPISGQDVVRNAVARPGVRGVRIVDLP